ncbi:MAG: ribulose-phosphate 3-epimerase [Acidimicrobiales bacterium]|nr:ribulose-phosphate 3-epimerase [Acidimicrobiales bacterium]MCB9372750.1 ribulose-phosphate 3-epimerase [Microthrixaceae bacterium]
MTEGAGGGTVVERLRALGPTVSVGMLTADLGNLARDIAVLEGTGVGVVHFDVMDGCFCPMTTIGPPVVAAVRTSMLKDVHLMIEAPLRKVAAYVQAGADLVTVHLESDRYVRRVLVELGDLENVNDPGRGVARGVALLPGTPVAALEPVLDLVDYVLVLAVDPGWGGQRFGPPTPQRVGELRTLLDEARRDVLVGVDGGVTRANIGEVAATGADVIVTGSAVFDGVDPGANARFMLDALARRDVLPA